MHIVVGIVDHVALAGGGWTGEGCDDCPENWAGDSCDVCPASNWVGESCDLCTGAGCIAAGTDHTCALDSEGEVTCWGWAGFGQNQVPKEAGLVSIIAGKSHYCALTSEGKVTCWGADWDGQSTPPDNFPNP